MLELAISRGRPQCLDFCCFCGRRDGRRLQEPLSQARQARCRRVASALGQIKTELKQTLATHCAVIGQLSIPSTIEPLSNDDPRPTWLKLLPLPQVEFEEKNCTFA